MKRLAILTLALMAVFQVVGCSGGAENEPGQSADNKMDQQDKPATGDNQPKTEGM